MALSDQMAGGGDTGGAGVPFDGFTVPIGKGRLRAADPIGDGPGAVVELTVPALTGYLGVVRTATAGLAARLSFTLDEIEDLRIAVDQACVMLLSLPGPQPPGSATLTCRFRVSDEALAVAVSAWVDDQAVMPAEQSFAWQVLTAHAAEVTGRAEHGRAVVELLKRRQRR